MHIKIYNFIMFLFLPVILFFFFLRILLDKEDKKRFIEKLSFPSKNRSGKKKIIWFHASSVGEIKSVYTLIDKFITNNYLVLVTTNTYLSSVVVKKDFPKSVVHQYLPIDFILFPPAITVKSPEIVA